MILPPFITHRGLNDRLFPKHLYEYGCPASFIWLHKVGRLKCIPFYNILGAVGSTPSSQGLSSLKRVQYARTAGMISVSYILYIGDFPPHAIPAAGLLRLPG